MRYCNTCQKITSGRLSYCNCCGKSCGQKLCSRGHANPRGAEACSECGSRNLSTPHQRGSVLTWLLVAFGLILPFTVLLLLTPRIYRSLRKNDVREPFRTLAPDAPGPCPGSSLASLDAWVLCSSPASPRTKFRQKPEVVGRGSDREMLMNIEEFTRHARAVGPEARPAFLPEAPGL
jgi:hypothetical protein